MGGQFYGSLSVGIDLAMRSDNDNHGYCTCNLRNPKHLIQRRTTFTGKTPENGHPCLTNKSKQLHQGPRPRTQRCELASQQSVVDRDIPPSSCFLPCRRNVDLEASSSKDPARFRRSACCDPFHSCFCTHKKSPIFPQDVGHSTFWFRFAGRITRNECTVVRVVAQSA